MIVIIISSYTQGNWNEKTLALLAFTIFRFSFLVLQSFPSITIRKIAQRYICSTSNVRYIKLCVWSFLLYASISGALHIVPPRKAIGCSPVNFLKQATPETLLGGFKELFIKSIKGLYKACDLIWLQYHSHYPGGVLPGGYGRGDSRVLGLPQRVGQGQVKNLWILSRSSIMCRGIVN